MQPLKNISSSNDLIISIPKEKTKLLKTDKKVQRQGNIITSCMSECRPEAGCVAGFWVVGSLIAASALTVAAVFEKNPTIFSIELIAVALLGLSCCQVTLCQVCEIKPSNHPHEEHGGGGAF